LIEIRAPGHDGGIGEGVAAADQRIGEAGIRSALIARERAVFSLAAIEVEARRVEFAGGAPFDVTAAAPVAAPVAVTTINVKAASSEIRSRGGKIAGMMSRCLTV